VSGGRVGWAVAVVVGRAWLVTRQSPQGSACSTRPRCWVRRRRRRAGVRARACARWAVALDGVRPGAFGAGCSARTARESSGEPRRWPRRRRGLPTACATTPRIRRGLRTGHQRGVGAWAAGPRCPNVPTLPHNS